MLLTKFGKHPIKHVEEEAIIVRKKERKKELETAPFAKGTGKVRRMEEVTAFEPCDPKSKFEPISFEEGSTWCICMSYIDKVRNIEEIMHFLVKIKV